MPDQTHPVSLSHRFAALVRGLRNAVIGRGHQIGLPTPLLNAISLRLTRMATKFEFLLRTAQTSPLAPAKPPRPYRPRAPRPETPRPYRPDPVPRHHAWLLRLVPATEIIPNICLPHRAALEQIFADPTMRALIAQTPALHPPLRSLCRMLGLPRPSHLPPPTQSTPTQSAKPNTHPRTPRAIRPPKPSPFPTPLSPPTPWDQRQAFRAFFSPLRCDHF
ncbi:hypothetical protein ACOSOMT5_P1310 [Acidiphilium sp. MT5]